MPIPLVWQPHVCHPGGISLAGDCGLPVGAQAGVESVGDELDLETAGLAHYDHDIVLYFHFQVIVVDIAVGGVDEVPLLGRPHGFHGVELVVVGACLHLHDV